MNKVPKTHKAVGIMSGTSLDGVDAVACSFTEKNGHWDFKILYGETYSYKPDILNRLKTAQHLAGLDLAILDVDYGRFIGEIAKSFCNKNNFKPDFISSHGYTVFHQPDKGLTLQIGSGAQIAAITGVKTVCDFRTSDVALGGQGAPLVPIGDKLLFNNYNACLNLGGFSNISFNNEGSRMAFDVCPVNYILNSFANTLGKDFDEGGKIGRGGKIISELLNELNNLEYYSKVPPKSLGREFVEHYVFPFFAKEYSIPDLFRTFYEHIAIQIASVINRYSFRSVLCTGGGAYNVFLMDLIKQHSSTKLVIPNNDLVDLKEALVFAFLGLLRLKNMPNCLASVTGASNDNIGGTVFV